MEGGEEKDGSGRGWEGEKRKRSGERETEEKGAGGGDRKAVLLDSGYLEF